MSYQPRLDADPKHPFAGLALHHFGAILADPPIPFKTRSAKGEGRSPQAHYRCPELEETFALPVASIAAPNCWLFLWVPLRSMPIVEPLMNAWGFEYSGSGFGWVKLNKKSPGFFMGQGFTTRKNLEICWLGRRGKPKRLSARVKEIIASPVGEHSRKPDEVYARIEEYCVGPFVELYARQRRPGWTSWGDQVDQFAEAAS